MKTFLFKPNVANYLVGLASCLVLATAYAFEYLANLQPCVLCIYQRIPYLIAIVFTFLGLSYLKNLIWLYALLITFFISFTLSGYHLGIEQEIFKEFSVLSSRPTLAQTRKIKHHLYGIITVKKNFSAGDWLKQVKKKINICKKKNDYFKNSF